ncbi:hypothetical protein D3C73_1088100 [compost metagenome]
MEDPGVDVSQEAPQGNYLQHLTHAHQLRLHSLADGIADQFVLVHQDALHSAIGIIDAVLSWLRIGVCLCDLRMTDYVREVRDTDTGRVFLQCCHGAVVDGLLYVVDHTRPLCVVERNVIGIAIVQRKTTTKGHQAVERVFRQPLRTHVGLLQMRKRRVHTVEDCTVPRVDRSFTLYLQITVIKHDDEFVVRESPDVSFGLLVDVTGRIAIH